MNRSDEPKCRVFSEGLIERFSQNWDSERITLLDSILLRMTIAELISFPEIPPKVSINVALDLAKRFSTDNSPAFINGMLDGIYTELQTQNLIQKTGRGLIEK
ncbi:MAG: transcription antitermination protein NusB [Ignavibacteria bacterium]|nr:transcription antitermination protein NusB [Ignavibacteria bacterium]